MRVDPAINDIAIHIEQVLGSGCLWKYLLRRKGCAADDMDTVTVSETNAAQNHGILDMVPIYRCL